MMTESDRPLTKEERALLKKEKEEKRKLDEAKKAADEEAKFQEKIANLSHEEKTNEINKRIKALELTKAMKEADKVYKDAQSKTDAYRKVIETSIPKACDVMAARKFPESTPQFLKDEAAKVMLACKRS